MYKCEMLQNKIVNSLSDNIITKEISEVKEN